MGLNRKTKAKSVLSIRNYLIGGIAFLIVTFILCYGPLTTAYFTIANVVTEPTRLVANLLEGTHEPTYSEMVAFIKEDKTNTNQYTMQYTCDAFSKDVINNAKKKGIHAGYVTLYAPTPPNHAIVCFATTDSGLWFVEPQLDIFFNEQDMNQMLQRQRYSVSIRQTRLFSDGIPQTADDRGIQPLPTITYYFDFEMYSYSIDWYCGY
jgi:hypothetical protein